MRIAEGGGGNERAVEEPQPDYHCRSKASTGKCDSNPIECVQAQSDTNPNAPHNRWVRWSSATVQNHNPEPPQPPKLTKRLRSAAVFNMFTAMRRVIE